MLTVALVKDRLALRWQDRALRLGEKWVVFYALLGVHHDRFVSTDEVCDHHPWTNLRPSVAGRDLWRFTSEHEARHFGQRISRSPARQGSKLFTLALPGGGLPTFEPGRPAVADDLSARRVQAGALQLELGECALLLQGGLVGLALDRLGALRPVARNVNDRAQLEALAAQGLEEQGGWPATAAHLPTLRALLAEPGLSRVGRARVLVRLARHLTLAAEYAQAGPLYAELRPLLTPHDGVDYCWYHLNYGLYLRRIGQLERALHHQRLAHDVAQAAQWWHGVYAARSNLVLIDLSLAEQAPPRARARLLRRALDWAQRTHSLVTLTRQPVAMTETALLLARCWRLLGEDQAARHWLARAREVGHHPDPQAHLAVVGEEEARLEEAAGNHFLAHLAREGAARQRRPAGRD